MHLLVVTCPDSVGHPDQRAAIRVPVLRLVPHAEHTDTTAEILKLALPSLVEGLLDGMPLSQAQFARANELVEGLPNELLQIARG